MTCKTITVVTLTQDADGWTASTFTDDASRMQFTTTKADTEDEAVEDLIDMCKGLGVVAGFDERVIEQGQRRLI